MALRQSRHLSDFIRPLNYTVTVQTHSVFCLGFFERHIRIELTSPAWQAGTLTIVLMPLILCSWVGSNHRPLVYQTSALNQLSYTNIIYTEPSRYLGMDVSIPWGPQLLTFRRPFGLLKQHHCLSTSVFVGNGGIEPPSPGVTPIVTLNR